MRSSFLFYEHILLGEYTFVGLLGLADLRWCCVCGEKSCILDQDLILIQNPDCGPYAEVCVLSHFIPSAACLYAISVRLQPKRVKRLLKSLSTGDGPAPHHSPKERFVKHHSCAWPQVDRFALVRHVTADPYRSPINNYLLTIRGGTNRNQ